MFLNLKSILNLKEEVESVEEGKSDRPLGVMHQFARGVKQKRGAKRNEGGKYLSMQTTKKQNKKSADADAYREKQKNERGLSMYPEEVEVTEGKYSKSETYVKGTAPVRATYGGKTESFPKETYKKKSKKVEVDEKYQGMYQSPAPTHNRLMSSDEKARMAPGRRAMAKSDELEKSEPGSKRAKAQKKASMQMARNFKSARATKEEVEVSEGDKYDNVGKQAARMSLLNNPGPRSTPEQTAEKKARLEKKRGMKLDDHPQFKKEEVDKRRAPSELVARLSAKREGHMAQDGPNKAAYDAKQRILKKTKDKMTEEIVRSILDEAGKKCWKGYKKAGTQKLFGKTYNRCVKANEELSIDQQMKISRDYNRMSPEEKKAANKKAMGNVKKVAPKKDTRTDAQKMTDATGPRPGSRYRGD